MPVDAAAVTRVRNVLDVRGERGAEQLLRVLGGGGRVGHGVAEGDALVGHGAARLRAAFLEAARGGGFVCRPVLAIELVVGELDDHLDVCVGAAFEFLDQSFAVALVGLHAEFVGGDLLGEVSLSVSNVLVEVWREGEAEGCGVGEVRADFCGVEGEGVCEDEHVCVVVQAVGRGAVHHRVLACEACSAIVVNDELEGLVEPAVGAITVPVLMGTLLKGNWGGVVKADDKRGGLDGFDGGGVDVGCGLEAGVHFGPDVAVLRGERADRGGLVGLLVDALELLF